jgi:peroxygenase
LTTSKLPKTPKAPKSPPAGRKAGTAKAGVLPRTMKARSRPGDTTLQRHASFFDDNGDRGIDVAECTRGLKALGMPAGVAESTALAIVAPLSYQTRGSLAAMNIDIDNVQKGKHDSDTGILDKRGRFNARRFAKVFGAHATVDADGNPAVTAAEITRMVNANRETLVGFVASLAEWQLLLLLAADTEVVEDGGPVAALSVARIKAFYDGTLFYALARERAKGRRAKR